MKVIIRLMTLMILGLCVIYSLLSLMELTVNYDELNTISEMAMKNTQIIMQENIEDRLFNTNNARLIIDNNEKYEQVFIENLNDLKRNENHYSVRTYGDYLRGLLAADVCLEYRTMNGDTRKLHKKLVNVIDVLVKNDEIFS